LGGEALLTWLLLSAAPSGETRGRDEARPLQSRRQILGFTPLPGRARMILNSLLLARGEHTILSLDQKSGWIIGAVELQPISTAKLYREDDDRELKFLNDQDGKTTSLMFGKLEAKRE
jgi:hypothetical protein